MSAIDWAPFDRFSENTNDCRCGATYRSHCKATTIDGTFTLVSRKPCPGCGETVGNIRKSSSDPETMEIRGKGES